MNFKNIYPVRYYAIGHSYLLHGPFEGWQTKGFWGMAASEPEKDYFHRVQQRLRDAVDCSVEAIAENYATYERLCTVDATPETYQESAEYAAMCRQLKEFKPNLITVYLGGGNTIANDPKSLEQFFRVLYTMIRENMPENAVVICPFSNSKTLFAMDIARQFGFYPVELMYLHEKGRSPENPYYAIGQYPAYEDAVKAGAIEFRTHPGDGGHDAIAREIVAAAVPLLQEKLQPEKVLLPQSLQINAPEKLSGVNAQVRLTVTPVPADSDDSVIWSVDNEHLATIDRQGNLIACNNGSVTVFACSTACPEIRSSASIRIIGQKPWFTLTYLPGTEDPVSRIPEKRPYLKDAISLKSSGAAYLPMRRGYRFIGWSDVTDGNNDAIAEAVQMDRDRTVRANWCIAESWDFDTMYDSAGVRMGGFNVRYENSIARVSSATGTGAAVYHEMLWLPAEDYHRFVVKMKLDCETPEKGVRLSVMTTEGVRSSLLPITAQTMETLTMDLSGISGAITGFRIEPQMTDCCIYVDRIAFE